MLWSWAAWGAKGHLAVPRPLTGWVSTAVKSIRGEYYLNGHWTIEAAQALPVASTVLQYERGVEGDLAPERLQARGPTSEPLVIEVSRVSEGGALHRWAARATVGRGWGARGTKVKTLSAAPQSGVQPRSTL